MKDPTIPSLLMKSVPSTLLVALEESQTAGARRAYQAASGSHEGHLAHVLGTQRHFKMNESFYITLCVNGIEVEPLRGNKVVMGQSGIFRIGRFNIGRDDWTRAGKSKTRKQMSLANDALVPLVQGDLLTTYRSPAEAVVFIVNTFSGSPYYLAEGPIETYIAVPDAGMTGWLFKEPLKTFLTRYNVFGDTHQQDLAVPMLKPNFQHNKNTRNDGDSA